jgi:rsbT co-antagonist protein RsbR
MNTSRLPAILKKYEAEILADWLKEQQSSLSMRADLMNESELREQCTQFLRIFQHTAQTANLRDLSGAEWAGVKAFLADVSRSRGKQGFSPSETATFVFSLKQPIFSRLRAELDGNEGELAEEFWAATMALDKLGLFTTEIYQKTREEVINRQQQEMLELSTPVVQLWEGVLALPMIGTLDSHRTQIVMETLLQRIVETGAEVAIIDITGVPTVDTLVAQHLLKTVTAARLMGADCVISGIRPNIAATIVHLGVNLGDVVTKANMADAFQFALRKSGRMVGRRGNAIATQGSPVGKAGPAESRPVTHLN